MGDLPPHNQRRLNAKIGEVYPGKYLDRDGRPDWFLLAMELIETGATYAQVCERFAILQVPISVPTLAIWLRDRREQAAA